MLLHDIASALHFKKTRSVKDVRRQSVKDVMQLNT
jgi:hypothetical protein